MKYEYLKKFIIDDSFDINNLEYHNNFTRVSELRIKRVEKELGFKFPQALKEFWLEIGNGCLFSSEKEIGKPMKDLEAKSASNIFWGPEELANMMSDDEEREGYDWLAQYALSLVDRPNAIPFFEKSDSSFFLYMFPGDNAVYEGYNCEDGVKMLEPHLSDFVYKLYHESAIYYSWAKREPE